MENTLNKKQLQQMEERKIIEESEIALMKQFFNDKRERNSNLENNDADKKSVNIENKTKINKTKISKQKENKLRQKETSVKLKLQKMKDKKHSDIFGEVLFQQHEKYREYDNY
jgi:hypothetical protein